MPKIASSKSVKSYHLGKISCVAIGLLNHHNQLNWRQRTRSNRAKGRLENLYFALGELETVLSHWKDIINCSKLSEEEEKAKRTFVSHFGGADCLFVDVFLRDIAAFRRLLLEAFLQPLIDAFPKQLPTEILLKIWLLAQPHFTLTLPFIDLVEIRKFFILLKTTVLAVYNAAIKGKFLCTVGHFSIFLEFSGFFGIFRFKMLPTIWLKPMCQDD